MRWQERGGGDEMALSGRTDGRMGQNCSNKAATLMGRRRRRIALCRIKYNADCGGVEAAAAAAVRSAGR